MYSMLYIGCATSTKFPAEVLFRNAPEDLKVYEGIESLHLERLEDFRAYSFGDSFSDEMNGTKTTHYALGILLTPTDTTHTITIESEGKTAEVVLVPHLNLTRYMSYFGQVSLYDLGPDGSPGVVDVSEYLKE